MLQSQFDPYVNLYLFPPLGIQLSSLRPPNLSQEHSQRPLPDNTQYSQETDIHVDIHVSTGIRIRNVSRRAAVDPRRRSCSQLDRRRMI